MSTKIKVLPDHLINQIAAGEVVENAASAIKELVENALDAGASRVVVTLEKGGYQMLSVADDGSGMSEDDAVLCFERHATSKIRLVEDLNRLSTMGFRGEALAALAAVSKITLTTATAHQEGRGTKIEIAAGRLLAVTSCGRSPGTTLEVRNLFYNIAARRKFQPSQAKSERDILRIMTAFSLGYPHVEFVLCSEGVQTLYAKRMEGEWPCTAKKRIQDVLGEEFLVFERPVRAKEMGYSLDGFLSAPQHHRPQRSGQYLFVEGRYVFSAFLSRSVREAFSTRIPEGRHPSFVLYLQLPPGEVDVNVHPQKKEVRFRNEAFLNRFIQGALQSSFLQGEYSAIPATSSCWGTLPLSSAVLPLPSASTEALPWELQEDPSSFSQIDRRTTCHQMELSQGLSQPEIVGLFDKYLIVTALSMPGGCPIFIGEKQEGLVLINLTLARMRMAFEEIIDRNKNPNTSSQRLLIPRKIQLPKPEAALLQKRLADLSQIGLEIQVIGEKEFLIEGMPRFLEIDDVEEMLMAGLEENERESKENDLLHRLALRASAFARWNKERGSLADAKGLIESLLRSQEPYFSPRGKPIMALLDIRDLERLFMNR